MRCYEEFLCARGARDRLSVLAKLNSNLLVTDDCDLQLVLCVHLSGVDYGVGMVAVLQVSSAPKF